MDKQTDGNLRPALLGRLCRRVDLKTQDWRVDLRGICELTGETKVLHWSTVGSLSVCPKLTAACQCHPTYITDVCFLFMHQPNMA